MNFAEKNIVDRNGSDELTIAQTVPEASVKVDEEKDQYIKITQTALGVLAKKAGHPELELATNLLFNSIFDAETDAVQEAMEKISDKLKEIQKQLMEMTAALSTLIKSESIRNSLQSCINSFTKLTADYYGVSDKLTTEIKEIQKDQDIIHRNSIIKEFLLTTVSNETFNSNNKFHEGVITLGENILIPYPLLSVNIFDTFDKLVVYTFKWEQYGYKARRAFQANVISLYINLAAISMLSLSAGEEDVKVRIEDVNARIKDAKARGEDKRAEEENHNLITLQEKLDQVKGSLDPLKKQIIRINDLADRYTVVERLPDQRYYQVPGHERLLKMVAVDRTLNPTFPDHPSDWITKTHLEDRVINYDRRAYPYPSPDWFKSVYYDYSGTNKNLNDIFFNEDEGNLTPPPGIPLDLNTIYLTNQHHEDKDIVFGTHLEYYITKASPDGTTSDTWIGNVYLKGDEVNAIRDWNNVQMMAIIDITKSSGCRLGDSELKTRVLGME